MAVDQEAERPGFKGQAISFKGLLLLHSSVRWSLSVKDSIALQNATTRWGLSIQNTSLGPGEMAQGIRAYTALAEDLELGSQQPH